MKISYECTELIAELQKDILEFGDIELLAFFDKKIFTSFGITEEVTILTDYDFVDEDMPLESKELGKSVVQIMKASEILKILEEQNSII